MDMRYEVERPGKNGKSEHGVPIKRESGYEVVVIGRCLE